VLGVHDALNTLLKQTISFCFIYIVVYILSSYMIIVKQGCKRCKV